MGLERLNTPWRIISTAIYEAPRDGRTHGTMEVDVTQALAYINKQRKQKNRITITHLATAALGRAIGFYVPEMNAYVCRGKLVPHKDVIVTVAVNAGDGGEMTSIKIRNAHNKTVFQIADEIRERAQKARTGTENKVMKNKHILLRVPWPFRNILFKIVRFLTSGLGLEIKSFGLTHDAFGSILLTNIGSHGLTTGTAALFPGSNLPAVIIMGKAQEKPVVRDGQIVIRTIMPVSATLDHRVADGFHGGRLATAVIDLLQHPEKLGELNNKKDE